MPLLDKLLGGKGLPDPLGLFGRGGGRGGIEGPQPGGLSRQFGGPHALGGSHLADALTRAGYTTPGSTSTANAPLTGGTGPAPGAPGAASALPTPSTPGQALVQHLAGGTAPSPPAALPGATVPSFGSPAAPTAAPLPGPALPMPGPVAGALQTLGQAVHGLLGGRGVPTPPVALPGAPGAQAGLPGAGPLAGPGSVPQTLATAGLPGTAGLHGAAPVPGAIATAPVHTSQAPPNAVPLAAATGAPANASAPGLLAGAARALGDAVGGLLGLPRPNTAATAAVTNAATPAAASAAGPAGAAPTAVSGQAVHAAQAASPAGPAPATPPGVDAGAPARPGATTTLPAAAGAAVQAPATPPPAGAATAAAHVEQAAPAQMPRGEPALSSTRNAAELPAPARDAAAQQSSVVAGSTATALAATTAAGATVLAAGAPPAGERVADARLAQGTTADLRAPVREPPPGAAYTADGPMRRRLRERLRTMPGAMTRLLVTLGLAGPQILVRDADPERERQRALQQVFWVLALVAYGCLGLSLLMLLPALREGELAPAAAAGGGASLVVGLAAAVAAWWVTHRLTRRGTGRRR